MPFDAPGPLAYGGSPMIVPLILTASLLGGWKAETANVELPVPKAWRFNPNVFKPSPTVPNREGTCFNAIWFDFLPGATREYAQQLIETESLDVTTAIRRWDVAPYTDVELSTHPAAVMRVEDRSVYLVPFDAGVLIAQAMAQGSKAEACLPLQDGVAARLVELFFAPAVQKVVAGIAATEKAPPLKVVEPVPATLDEALVMLEKTVHPDVLARIRASKNERDMIAFHHGIGRGLRNGWGLWGRSPLKRFFEPLGVFHPDDISGIILTSFWRKLHDVPINLEGQASEARRYWGLRKQPSEINVCRKGAAAQPVLGLEGPDRFVQVYVCGSDDYRAYELDGGWYAPDEKLKARVKTLRRQRVVSAPLDEQTPGGIVTPVTP